MKTTLIRLSRWRKPKILSETMYHVPSWTPRDRLAGVNIHFETVGFPGEYILELDPAAVRYLYREFGDIIEKDENPPPRGPQH